MEEDRMAAIPVGSILTITTGCYSNYIVAGVFRAKATIDAELLRHEWLNMHPKQKLDCRFDEAAFLGWVASRGLIEPIDCVEWHLSDYSKADEMWIETMQNEVAS